MYKLEFSEEYEENDDFYFDLGKCVLVVKPLYRDILFFQLGRSVISEDPKIFPDILSRLKDTYNEIEGNESIAEIHMDINSLSEDQIELTKRYLGESLSHTLKNRLDLYFVVEERNKIFKAVHFDLSTKKKDISLYNGFQFKIYRYNGQFSIVIDSRAKFFSEYSLRDEDLSDFDEWNRGIELLCPVSDCKYNMQAFSPCRYSIPKYLCSSEEASINDERAPGDIEIKPGINLIDFFGMEENCPSHLLIDKSKIQNIPPVFAYFTKKGKTYHYPLELLRKVPRTDDAGNEASGLNKLITLEPFKRFTKIISDKDLMFNISDIKFPVIIENESLSKGIHTFTKPKYYTTSDTEITGAPWSYLKDHPPDNGNTSIFFKIILSETIKDIKEFNKLKINLRKVLISNRESFKNVFGLNSVSLRIFRYSNQSLDYILKEKIFNHSDFYIVIKIRKEAPKTLRKALISGNIPFHTLDYNSIIEYDKSRLNNIFLGLYHLMFPPYWLLKPNLLYDTILALTIRHFKEEKSITALAFEPNGCYRSGFYLIGSESDCIDQFKGFLKDNKISNGIVFVSSNLTDNIKSDLITIKNLDFIAISDNSLVRIFHVDSKKEVTDTNVDVGTGILIENEMHLVTFNSSKGTQRCLKLTNIQNHDDEKFIELCKECFKFTQYHLGFTRNQIKEPWPLHITRITNNKLYMLGFRDLKIPNLIYLGGKYND